MKMKVIFLLVASVFFVSCGMPTIFNLSTGEYSLQPLDNPNANQISGSLTISTTNAENIATLTDSDTKGPSLMFFYTISGSDDSEFPINTVKGSLESAFSSKIKKEPFGINNQKYHELVFTEKDGKKASLYGFSGTGNNPFRLPDYVLQTSTGVIPNLAPFTFEAKQMPGNPSRYYIQLTTPVGTFIPATTDLYGFEGYSFMTDQDEIARSTTGEYEYLPTGANEIYINIFSAFSITGNFTNLFWSTLKHIGQIKLPLP